MNMADTETINKNKLNEIRTLLDDAGISSGKFTFTTYTLDRGLTFVHNIFPVGSNSSLFTSEVVSSLLSMGVITKIST